MRAVPALDVDAIEIVVELAEPGNVFRRVTPPATGETVATVLLSEEAVRLTVPEKPPMPVTVIGKLKVEPRGAPVTMVPALTTKSVGEKLNPPQAPKVRFAAFCPGVVSCPTAAELHGANSNWAL